ncbi:MAG: SHOCT domain-containing protein [Streptosporangiaceae bacterium]
MGDPVVPERPGGRHAAEQEIPARPVILPSEQVPAVPYPLLDGLSQVLGWQFRPPAKGGPAFVMLRRTGLGSLKVIEYFPLNDDGWVDAWRSLVAQSPGAAAQVVAALKAREADAARLRTPVEDSREMFELDARSLVSLREVAYLGGYVPESPIRAGERYDVRFVEDRFLVFGCRQAEVLAEVPYREVEDVEIGGPGLVRTGGGFAGGGFGVRGAVEGMAIAAVLNALTTRTSIKTVLRLQGTGCELFLLHTGLTPERLRIAMSRPLGAIRSARATGAAGRIEHGVPAISASPVEDLTKLADMLEKGLLTREEFDLMKAKLLSPPTHP